MAGEAQQHQQIMAAASRSLANNRAGGRRSIGRRSAEIKQRHYAKKLARVAMAIGAILVGTMAISLIVDGIGVVGFMGMILAIVVAALVLARYPRMKVPTLPTLNTGDVRTMVGRTELWLEAQRPALPPPAVQLVDQIGVQLDGLGVQLEGIDPAEPAAQEVRKLVGEHLPGMVESYRRIPAHLRREERGGRTADQQLADGLGKISREIDDVTRRLAAGDLDALAVQGRYLDYKYGDGLAEADGAAKVLPAPGEAT